KKEANFSDEEKSVNRGCRDTACVIGPLLEGANVSNEGDCRRQVADVDVALPQAVYTGVQMLEIHPKSPTLSHFLDRPARLRGGTARSATRYSIARSDMTRVRPGHLKT